MSAFFLTVSWGQIVSAPSVGAQSSQEGAELETVTVLNEEGGPVQIVGQVSYSYAFFTTGVAAPMVILEDQAGFIDRNEHFIFPVESQTLGQITSDFYTSPFSYTISLPVEPQGTRRDVDNNGSDDTGVMVFAVAYWTNTFGDPFLERRDLFGGGWSTAYASTRVSSDISTRREIVGGTFIVYAKDNGQGFPTGFGEDELLFTEDDPIALLPQGYTLVDMDTEPFTFDRSRYPRVDLIEPQSSVTEDFSALPYDGAFDAMLNKLRREYAFTDFKSIDWDELSDQFRPRFVQATTESDSREYRRALRDFITSIPDGHMSGPFISNEFRRATAGGLGMALRELNDGRVVVHFLTENGPAAEAGIQIGAEIVQIEEEAVASALDAVEPWSAPFSTDHVQRLQQLRYIVRMPLGESRTLTFLNPDATATRTVTLKAIAEDASFRFSSMRNGLTGYELPLEYKSLDSGYVYVKIYRFSDNELLTIQLWERLIRTLNELNAPGLLIDMRQNSGGSGFLADQMAAYFFDSEHMLGNAGRYNAESNGFYFDERSVDQYFLPPENLRYSSNIAVLIGPNCNSACEFFSYNMTIDDRAVIVGQYPTAGLGGSIDVFIMPEDERIQFTAGRAVDVNGRIHIEGRGVAPHIQVPVNLKTLFSDGDPVLEAATAYLDSEDVAVVEGGRIAIGEEISGGFEPGRRTQYSLPVAKGDIINLTLAGTDPTIDTILRVYSKNGALLVENDDSAVVNARFSSIEKLLIDNTTTIVVEAGTFRDQEGGSYTLKVVRESNPIQEIIDTLQRQRAISEAESEAGLEASTVASMLQNAQNPGSRAKPPVDRLGIATVVTRGGRLRVRAGPTTRSEVVGYIGVGAQYDVIDFSRDGGWVRLLVNHLDDGDSGWVAIDYVDIQVTRSSE
ncbi:MAG: S41 family peptidase [Chloroflexota bacterium]